MYKLLHRTYHVPKGYDTSIHFVDIFSSSFFASYQHGEVQLKKSNANGFGREHFTMRKCGAVLFKCHSGRSF